MRKVTLPASCNLPHIILSFFLLLPTYLIGQTAQEEIADNVYLSGYYLTAYPYTGQSQQTPPPSGKAPFYISHYGRHGSRYLGKASYYTDAVEPLQAAEAAGKLTDFGRQILSQLLLMQADAADRYEELTPVGAQQWQDIGRRMAINYPEVFHDSARIDARSTTYTRCILSMSNMVQALKAQYPFLEIEQSASQRDMATLLPNVSSNSHTAIPVPTVNGDRVMSQLFSDSSYIAQTINSDKYFLSLFEVVSSLQNTSLRDSISLYELFNDDELYQAWQRMNVRSYNSYHRSTVARPLLQRIIEDAESAITRGQPATHLRFGHESVLLPLVCLMSINQYDHNWSSADEMEAAGWRNYNIYPMAGNIQLIFYRSNPADSDVLVKILLNEAEATLPIESDMAPYYHWEDVKDFWLGK